MKMAKNYFNHEKMTLDIIAFRLHDRDFCLETRTIREIRGWGKSTPVPHAPREVLGVLDLRGAVIPIVDLAVKLGMPPIGSNERSAIIVAEVGGEVVGLLVDGVSDLLAVDRSLVQPIPPAVHGAGLGFSQGMITHEMGMICFLDLMRLFPDKRNALVAAA